MDAIVNGFYFCLGFICCIFLFILLIHSLLKEESERKKNKDNELLEILKNVDNDKKDE